MAIRILILGGTFEARQLAERLAEDALLEVTMSLAGRTRTPVSHVVPVRTGGFGGAAGLAAYIRENAVDLLVDATHPFARQISENAVAAVARAGIPAFALIRSPWVAGPGDRWRLFPDIASAIAALGETPRKVFVALGRRELAALIQAPQHDYLVRSVDPVESPLEVPRIRYIQARGPFVEADEESLLRENAIDVIVAKNSGGSAAYGKIAAARSLAIAVHLVERPPAPALQAVATVDDAVARIAHLRASLEDLGE